MTLSLSSCLHYWSARYGSVPIVGGNPVHARNSAGSWIDQAGRLQSAIVNTPRFETADLGDGAGRRQVMRMEQARTNGTTHSEEGGSWTPTNATILANAFVAPDGTLSADELREDGTTNEHYADFVVPTTTANTKQSFSVFAQAQDREWIHLTIVDKAGTAKRAWFHVSAGTIGTVQAGVTASITPAAGGWVRCAITVDSSTGGGTLRALVGLATADGGLSYAGSSGLGVSLWGADFEADCASPSSYIKTVAAAVTRAADSFYWDFTPLPQAMMVYVRYVERFDVSAGDSRVWQIGASGDTNPRLVLAYNVGPQRRTLWQTSGGSVASDAGASSTAGDVVEIVSLIQSGGNVQTIQSKNGGAVTAGTLSGGLALPSAWGDTKLWLNGVGSTAPGLIDAAELKIVRYADVGSSTPTDIMAELRQFELDSRGAVL